MKKTLLVLGLLAISGIQANKVLTTGNETPEEMAQLVRTYGIQNQPAQASASIESVRPNPIMRVEPVMQPFTGGLQSNPTKQSASSLPIMAY
jgi:hypothetical protein